MNGFVKYIINGKIWLIEAVTDRNEVTNALLDELRKTHDYNDRENIKNLLKIHSETPICYVLMGAKKIEYDENLHG